MNIKIYTMTHKRFRKPEDQIYIPLHVGREGAEDLGYPGDDTGENISGLNWLYGELTGLYWVWKNEKEADVIGICHYRRYFLNDAGGFMTQEDYEEALSDCDVMVSELLSDGGCNRDNFGKAHNIADMDAVGEAIRKLYPEDYPAFCQVMADDKCCYGNLMVTSREKYNEYCQWLFSVFDEASGKIDVSGYDMYHKRIYGFLSEVLLYVWVVARGYRIREGRIGITSEKAETMELKQAIGQLIREGDIVQAKELFYGYLKLRPDVRENLSDIKGELPIIEQLLYIMHEEKRRNTPGLLDFCRDMQILMVHYKNVRKLIEQNGEKVREVGKNYFAEFPVSDAALSIITADVRGELSLYAYLNEGQPPKKVTVIVCAQNSAGVSAGCIGNLVHQTMPDVEIVFAGDCLKEEDRQIFLECQRQYPEKVAGIFWQEDQGAGIAWERALGAAGGEYVSFIRAEDVPDVAMYEKLYEASRARGGDIVAGSCIDADGNVVIMDEPKAVKEIWGRMIRRDLVEKYQRQSGGQAPEVELERFGERLMKAAESVVAVKEIVYCCRGN